MALFEIKNLNFSYLNSDKKVLTNIDLEINDGEFVVVCGESGCGKTTLLKLMKKQLIPNGSMSGSILYKGVEVKELDEKISASEVGFVMQNPDNQIVTDKVWHELSFGLENIGEDSNTIRRKVSEISGFFGITSWYHKNTCELSGGQKQLLNLASIMVMNPNVLILDEPTSQLDPIAATDFINTLKKINQELGVTIIIVEHRLEEVFPIADKVVLMDKAIIKMVDTPRNIGKKLALVDPNHKMNLGLPSSVKLYNMFKVNDVCPLTVKEGKEFLRKHCNNLVSSSLPIDEKQTQDVVIEIKDGFFRYERNSPDVLNGLNLQVYKNELLCILGGNASGKTTTLKVLSGVKRLYSGKYRLYGKKIKEYSLKELYRNNISMLPQNPIELFVKNSVLEDLEEVTKIMGYEQVEAKRRIDEVVQKLEIENILKNHPYDLSGGEGQKAAFAKVMLMNPKIIFLDEPTKGIDAYSKKVLADILSELKEEGITIVMATHDVEFASVYSDRCAMFFDGQVVSIDEPVKFFSSNNFYTTAASRISRGLYDNTVTCEMIKELAVINGIDNEK